MSKPAPSPAQKLVRLTFAGDQMKTVYSAQNIALLSIMESILAGNGITCHVRNQFLSAGSGEIPPVECWPQLCVDDADFPAAQRIVAEANAAPPLAAWHCDGCGEEIEGQFAVCWNCGRAAPGEGCQSSTEEL